MKITRIINGKIVEIELTPEEIYKAHREQERQNLYNDVQCNLEFYLSDDEYGLLKDNTGFISDVAAGIQDQMDYGNISFEAALEHAIENYKEVYLE